MQRVEFYVVSGKRWEWHLVLFKEWLRHVEGGITHRKYVKWLRTRKVFERAFIRFAEDLLGIVQTKKTAPRLNEIGRELLDELEAAERASAAPAPEPAFDPGEPMPMPAAPAQRRRRSDEELEQLNPDEASLPRTPSAENNPFIKALLERLTELNPYLCRFVFKEVGDDFMSPTEVYRRMGTADFVGVRPSMPMFETLCTWLEWLGGLQKVGFRHRIGPAGKELAAYLIEVPPEELLEADEEAEAGAEEDSEEDTEAEADAEEDAEEDAEVDAEADAEAGPEEYEDEDDWEEEGLDLPPSPEVAPGADPYWKTPEPTTPVPTLIPGLEALTADLRRMRGEGSSSAPPDEPPSDTTLEPTPAPRSEPAAAPNPAPVARAVAPPPPPPTGEVLGRRAALQQAVAWWLADASPDARPPVSLAPHPSGEPVGPFKLLALATLLEADAPPAEAVRLFERLDAAGCLEAMLVEGAPLDRVLEAAWAEPVAHAFEERLVHLVRYRAGLQRSPEALTAPDVRTLATQLQRDVTGRTLGAGLLLVIRSLVAEGLSPAVGLEAVAWLPSLLPA